MLAQYLTVAAAVVVMYRPKRAATRIMLLGRMCCPWVFEFTAASGMKSGSHPEKTVASGSIMFISQQENIDRSGQLMVAIKPPGNNRAVL